MVINSISALDIVFSFDNMSKITGTAGGEARRFCGQFWLQRAVLAV